MYDYFNQVEYLPRADDMELLGKWLKTYNTIQQQPVNFETFQRGLERIRVKRR